MNGQEKPLRLKNAGLRDIYTVLIPNQLPTEVGEELGSPGKEATPSTGPKFGGNKSAFANSSSTSTVSEFIPHLYYSLHQLRKGSSNSVTKLEASTGFIRHRLKTCKNLVSRNEDTIKLLSHSPEEWERHLEFREQELQVKTNLLRDLRKRIREMQANS